MKRLFKLGVWVAVFIVVMGLLQANRFWVAGGSEETVSITINQDQGLSSLVYSLSDEEVIKSKFWYKVYVNLFANSKSTTPGNYEVPKKLAYSKLVRLFTLSSTQEEVTLTIPEGFSLVQIEERVIEIFDVTPEQWQEAIGPSSPINTTDFIIQSGKPANHDLEGYLFPDTYRFFTDATALDIASTLVEQMEVVLNDVDPNLAAGRNAGYSLHEFLTLSSIVQKEVATESDKKRVAGIFHNRLDIGMSLQSDATVNYFTLKGMPSPTFADIAIEHPYNTYVVNGLTPGPISSPGRLVLDATAHPEEHNYFFFLTSPDGTAYYAETFDQHVANRIYLK